MSKLELLKQVLCKSVYSRVQENFENLWMHFYHKECELWKWACSSFPLRSTEHCFAQRTSFLYVENQEAGNHTLSMPPQVLKMILQRCWLHSQNQRNWTYCYSLVFWMSPRDLCLKGSISSVAPLGGSGILKRWGLEEGLQVTGLEGSPWWRL